MFSFLTLSGRALLLCNLIFSKVTSDSDQIAPSQLWELYTLRASAKYITALHFSHCVSAHVYMLFPVFTLAGPMGGHCKTMMCCKNGPLWI